MIMKKIAFVIAAVTAFVSCQKENIHTGETVQLSFRANLEVPGPDTKVALKGTDVVFVAGDALSVFDGSSNNKFQTEEGGSNALFQGTAANVASYLVVSPYSDSHKQISPSVVKFTIPDVQTATIDGVDPNALISAGLATPDGNVTLYNTVGLVQVVVPDGLKVKSIQVAGGKGQTIAIAGEFSFNADTKTFAIPDVSKTVSVITLVPAEGDEYIAPGTYYIAVRPKTNYDAGFSMAYVNESNQLCKRTTAKALDIVRSHIVPLGSLDTSNYPAVTGTAVLRTSGDEVQFTGRVKKIAGGTGKANNDDSTIKKIVFKAHTLYSQTYKTDAALLSSGLGTVEIHGYLVGNVLYVCTEASTFTLQKISGDLFRQFVELEEVIFSDVTTQDETSFSYMFRNDAKLRKVDFGNADFSKVKDFSYMFYVGEKNSLEYIDFGETATSAATTMQAMFNNSQNLKHLYLGTNFSLAPTVLNMFLNTGMQTSIDAAGDDKKKCQLYCSQSTYNAIKAASNTQFNGARFLLHAL